MLYVASPDYSQLRTNYLKAKSAYELAQRIAARSQELYQHGAIAQADLENAQAAEVQAQGDLIAAEAALKVLGISDPSALLKAPPSFEATVNSPINGLVVEQDVAVGQLLQPGATQCFVISDIGTVWVLVNVYQKDLPYITVGDPVTIQTDSYPDVFQGRISYVAASLDPTTRTLQARIETANSGHKLKKDMYVIASVNAGIDQERHRRAGRLCAARHRESAVRLCRCGEQSVWPALGHAGRKFERRNSNHRRTEARRSRHRRRQPVPAIRQLAATLKGGSAGL